MIMKNDNTYNDFCLDNDENENSFFSPEMNEYYNALDKLTCAELYQLSKTITPVDDNRDEPKEQTKK